MTTVKLGIVIILTLLPVIMLGGQTVSEGYQVAYQNYFLYTQGTLGTKETGVEIASGTSPSIAVLADGGYQMACQSNRGELWSFGNLGTFNLGGVKMASGTSPSIATLTYGRGGYQIAFQANTGHLWITGTLGTRDLGLEMMPGTSPSITALPKNGYQIAFQANTGELWVVGDLENGSKRVWMAPGTSPSIAALPGGNDYRIAFQYYDGNLWLAGKGHLNTYNLGLGMKSGTSPSIAALPETGYQIAFQANTSHLWVTGTLGTRDLGLGMKSGTSPSIAALPVSGYEVAFQANTGKLWLTGTLGTRDLGLTMARGTSPSICPVEYASLWITPASQRARAGDEVAFEIHMNTNTKVGAYELIVTYPADKFTVKSVTEPTSYSEESGRINFADFFVHGLPVGSDVPIIRIVLKAKNDASGAADIRLKVDKFFDNSILINRINILSVKNGRIRF